MEHIIRKQTIDILLKSGMDSFGIQQKLSNQYWNFIIPWLEVEFDNVSNDNDFLVIDSLVIDLGIIQVNDIDKIGVNLKFINIIKKQIQDQFIEEKTFKHSLKIRSTASNHFYQWFFYMANGYLNWNVSSVNDEWYEHVLQELASDIAAINQFRIEIRDNPFFLLRLIRQHSEDFLILLIKILAPNYIQESTDLINKFHKKLNAKKILNTGIGVAFYEIFWKKIITISALIPKEDPLNSSIKILNEIDLERLIPSQVQDESALDFSEDIINPDDLVEPDDHLFIQYAGLILLHPFLNSLFKNLELLQDKEFVNIKSQEKAIHLLHYAATGNMEPKEYELVVPKIICGYAIKSAIPSRVELTITERNEVDEMLESAISNWGILNNTSPDGLREGFLQRNGAVLIEMDKIKIRVEKGDIDMLLDYLPWNLSLIKLPWLKKIVQVEWR